MSEAAKFRQLLEEKLHPYCTLSEAQTNALYRHYSMMCRWNRSMSLTTVTELEEAVERHYCESLFAAVHIPRGVLSVGDIGSGAGFPGIPMAVYRPDVRVILVESQQRKTAFLREAGDGLANVQVRATRGDSWSDRVDLLVSRAVRPLDILELIPQRAPAFLLMIGETELKAISAGRQFEFQVPIRVPWGDKRYLLSGNVPRETQSSEAVIA